jgi:ABC-type sulfate/molybdate transport systems ATPase subunit
LLDVRIFRAYPGFTLDVAFKADVPVVALLGPSGAGKTQTLRAIAGAMRPQQGKIVVDGRVLFDDSAGVDLPPQARHVGYVPQHYALFPHLTVERNVAFGLAARGSSATRTRVAAMLETMGLSELRERRPSELSGGQQQRVALARALILQPSLLLLDEPFAALDTTIRTALRAELQVFQRALGFRALLVTHDPEDLVLAIQTFTFEDGRIVGSSTTPGGLPPPTG